MRPAPDELPTTFAQLREITEAALMTLRRGETATALRAADFAEQSLSEIDVPRSGDGAETLNRLGMIRYEAGFARAARPLYDRALTIAEELAPEADEIVEDVLNNLGQLHARLGDGERAQPLLERAVRMRRSRVPGSVALAVVLDNLGAVYLQVGDLGRAEEHHDEALAVFRRVGGPFDPHVAVALGNLGEVHFQRRDLARAEAFRLRALDIEARRDPTSPGSLVQLHGLVRVSLLTGDRARTDRLVNHCLTIGGRHPAPEHRAAAEALSALAEAAFAAFRLDLAGRLGLRALELLDALAGPDAPETLEALTLVAGVARATNDLDQAERLYRRAHDGYARTGDLASAAAMTIDLAKVYRARGAYPLASTLLTDAIAGMRTTSPANTSLLASAIGNLAEVHNASGRHELADQAYAEALDTVHDTHSERPWLLHGRAVLHHDLGEYETALDLYQEAQRAWARDVGSDHPFITTVTANLALVHWAVGDVDRALESFESAARHEERELRRVLAVGSERQRLAYAADSLARLSKVLSFVLSVAPERDDARRFAARLTLQRKGLVLDAVAQTVALLRTRPETEDRALVDRLSVVRSEIAAIVGPRPRGSRSVPDPAALARLRNEEDRLEVSLSHRGALHHPELAPVTVESVRAALPADAAMIDIVLYRRFEAVRARWDDSPWEEERYAAMVLRSAGDPVWIDLGPSSAIDPLGEQLRHCTRSRRASIEDYEQAAFALYATIIEPLEDAIDGASRLLVSPDAALTMVPLGAVQDPEGRTLDSRATVSYLTAGREVQYAAAVRSPATGVLVVADPDYDAEPPPIEDASVGFADRGRCAPLPGARAEAEDMAALFEDVTVLQGSAATVEAVQNAHAPGVLHIATHGFFEPLDPETRQTSEFLHVGDTAVFVEARTEIDVANPMYFSALAFAGANRLVDRTSSGILTAAQIAGLDLGGTELVVLSACETGLGAVGRGREFTGMRRALSIAGAAAQVTSLWKVDDLATRALMKAFYQLLVHGCPRAEALGRAQDVVRHHPEHPEWAHPFYWAAFVLSGAWTPWAGSVLARTGSGEEGRTT